MVLLLLNISNEIEINSNKRWGFLVTKENYKFSDKLVMLQNWRGMNQSGSSNKMASKELMNRYQNTKDWDYLWFMK